VSKPYPEKGLVPEHKRDQGAVLGRPAFYLAYWPFLTAVPLLRPALPTLFRPCRLVRVELDNPVGPEASCGLIVGSRSTGHRQRCSATVCWKSRWDLRSRLTRPTPRDSLRQKVRRGSSCGGFQAHAKGSRAVPGMRACGRCGGCVCCAVGLGP